jgi:protocatechuate 3,4-dioxygenase beta subunit
MRRREVLRGVGAGLAVIPLAALGCGDDGDAAADAGGGDAAPAPDARAGEWASGGTAAMTDKASYPDPFAGAVSSCVLVAATTEGPCTTEDDHDREDVSEGSRGLPVRLALKVVDDACNPVAGATVKIWHTNPDGVYSGETPAPVTCNDNDAAAIAASFFRGVQTTDADGVVGFDTCFPGWYPGRAIHIHLEVKSGAMSYRISQLFFPEDITQAIFASHPDYVGFGQPDTLFDSDSVMQLIPTASRPRHTFDVARMTDGAMLASKVVTVMSA